MRNTFLLLSLVLSLCAFSQEEKVFIRVTPDADSAGFAGSDSRNGYTIPARGQLHMLVVFVQFEEDVADTLNEFWIKNKMPHYSNWLFHPEIGLKADVPENISNYSDYFHSISLGQLHVTADVYPQLITISNKRLGSYNAANTRVVDTINARQKTKQDPPLNMEKYDRWTMSGVSAYHAKPEKPNGKIDFILFVYRNSGSVGNWIGAEGGVSAGFYGELMGLGLDNGYTLSGGMGRFYEVSSLIHELAHPLLGGNDYHTMSGTHSINLNSQRLLGLALNGGWGLMSEGAMFKVANAWERDRLGWNRDGQRLHKLTVDSIPDTGLTLHLRDYATFGDAVQIKLPHVDSPQLSQYIWIENHQKQNFWDSAFIAPDAECPELRSYLVPGIYMYYQVGMDDYNSLFVPREDFLKPISAEGSWDYEFTGKEGLVCLFGANELVYKKGRMNPLTGYNDINDRYYDVGTADSNYMGDGEIFGGANPKRRVSGSNNKCFVTPDSYNVSSCWDEKNRGNMGNIDFVPAWIEQVNGEVKVWQAKGPEESFQPGDKIGLGHNPTSASINYRYRSEYNQVTKQYYAVEHEENKIYLNGISVEVLSDSAGVYAIKVRKNDWDVPEHIRWCGGDIVLYDTVNVKPNVAVFIDQSETPNSNFQFDNGRFSPLTDFTCKAGSYFHLEALAQVIVEDGSSLILESGSKFEIHAGAKLVVKENSQFILQPGCELFLHDGGEVIIEEGAELLRDEEAQITLAGKRAEITIDGKRLFKRDGKTIRRRFRN